MALNKSITDLHGTTLASSNFKLREGEGGIRIRGELAEHTHTHTTQFPTLCGSDLLEGQQVTLALFLYWLSFLPWS